MRILVCYGTSEGQTRKIAAFVGEVLTEGGDEAIVDDTASANAPDPAHFDAAVLLGSIHTGRYQETLIGRIADWRAALSAMPTAFISVSLSAAGDDPRELAGIDAAAKRMFDETGWTPDKVLQAAGAFRFTQYGFLKRWIMRLIARRKGQKIDTKSDTEYTDWDAVRAFVEEFRTFAGQVG